jgi:hypothetical protein
MISSISPLPSVVFNAVGTTLFAAGSYAKQWAIDHDLCVANIRAAEAAGVKTHVYISSAGMGSAIARYWPYGKMKMGVENALREAELECGVVLRPGMIIGDREQSKSWVLGKGIGNLHWVVGRRVRDMIGELRSCYLEMMRLEMSVAIQDCVLICFISQAKIKSSLDELQWLRSARPRKARPRRDSGYSNKLTLSSTDGTNEAVDSAALPNDIHIKKMEVDRGVMMPNGPCSPLSLCVSLNADNQNTCKY